jgi:signal transduction histidine kinase
VVKSRLQEMLKTKPRGGGLTHTLKIIRSKARPLLSKIVETFPDYTTHDIRHSEAVLKSFDLVIPNVLGKKLNRYEIYFLIASAYLHDIGMVDFPELSKERLQECRQKAELVANHIRENHHVRTEEFVVGNFRDLGIEDEHQAKIIGRICRGHRKENLGDRNLFKADQMYKNHPINTPLLASFLRIADELDLTFERAPLVIFEHIPPKGAISVQEWEKQLSVSGVGPNPEDPTIIKCSGTCKNQKIHRALKSLETKINKELEDLPNHLHHYREFRRDLPRKFLIEIEAVDYKAYDLKFSLQENEIVNLLMGEKLYERKEESLRELLKNSVDGCRLRRELLKKQGLKLKPEIVFELTPDRDKIVVTDNGVGMDEDIIERYFTRIGRSFYRSPEFLEHDVDLSPVSELGIGILSCFMIANKIVIDTKTEDSEPLTVEIDDVSDYFFVRPGQREEIGTCITLFLNDEVKQEIDLEDEIRRYARHLEFPVKVILPDGKECIEKDRGFEAQMHEFVESLEEQLPYGWGLHLIKMREQWAEGCIGLVLQTDNILGLIPTGAYAFGADLSRLPQSVYVSNEGIFVGNCNVLPGSFQPWILLLDLNLKNHALDLNAARNDVVENAKFDIFARDMERKLVKELASYLTSLRRKAKKENVPYEELFSNLFAICIRPSQDLQELWRRNKLTDEFLAFLTTFSSLKSISKDGTYYMTYRTIVRTGKPIVMLKNLDWYDDEHIREMYCGCSRFTENKLYLFSGTDWASHPRCVFLFKDVYECDFTSLFDIVTTDAFKTLMPRSWKVGKFRNYQTSRFMEFSHPGLTMLNRQNRFVALLLRHRGLIKGDKAMALASFFHSFPTDLDHGFPRVTGNQKEILKWFVDAELLAPSEIDDYVLTPDDFPPHLFQFIE